MGRLGPSLFMTAIERRDARTGAVARLETLGRHQRRVAAMGAMARAVNGLDAPVPLREALQAPTGPFAALLAEGLREGAEHGDRATRAHCRQRLADPAATALVPCAKWAHPSNGHGWRGLTAAGRRSIRDAGGVLDANYGSLGFFTVTLPGPAAELASRAQVAEFQRRLLFLLRRRLVQLRLRPEVLLVAEMHPSRRLIDGAYVPHWHGVIRVSHRPYERWSFRKEDFNRAVLAAHRLAFGSPRGHTQRLQLLPQKTGAARYLSKYMAKGSVDLSGAAGTPMGRLCPRQWWSWTGELRELVLQCRLRPPSPFLRWSIRWRRELQDLGALASSGSITVGDDGAEIGVWVVWASEDALDQAMEAWLAEELATRDCQATGGVP